jgi:hypothetical protein
MRLRLEVFILNQEANNFEGTRAAQSYNADPTASRRC